MVHAHEPRRRARRGGEGRRRVGGGATEVASPVGMGREGSMVGSGVELGVMMQGVGRRGGERVGGVDRV